MATQKISCEHLLEDSIENSVCVYDLCLLDKFYLELLIFWHKTGAFNHQPLHYDQCQADNGHSQNNNDGNLFEFFWTDKKSNNNDDNDDDTNHQTVRPDTILSDMGINLDTSTSITS